MDEEYLESRIRQGWSLQRIATECNVHPSTVARSLKKCGLSASGTTRFAPRGAPDETLVRELVSTGATLHEMAEQADRSVATIRFWLQKWGLSTISRSARVSRAEASPIVERLCQRHGLTPFRLEGRGYYRCMRCRQERVSNWRRKVKRTLMREAGGKCACCGYDRCRQPFSSTISTQRRSTSLCRAMAAPKALPEHAKRQRSVYCYAQIATLKSRRVIGNYRVTLPGVDSNHRDLINSQACCRYITGERASEHSGAEPQRSRHWWPAPTLPYTASSSRLTTLWIASSVPCR